MGGSDIERRKSRRFSEEQIKSLEEVFSREKRLEPRKKVEMARELGLHPRQVAIWFQNRRARCKSKQVERDYANLKADYDSLTHRFQSLNKQKHDLLLQLSDLCGQLKQPAHDEGKDLDSGSENGSGPLAAGGRKEELVQNMCDENLSNFELGSLLYDQSCGSWWDIWSSN